MPRPKSPRSHGGDGAEAPAYARKVARALGIQVRGLCREEAARYVGVSASKFDQMVDDGRMPKPKHIDARRVWDRVSVDAAFDDLDNGAAASSWDGFVWQRRS